jgi:hypothetical protein
MTRAERARDHLLHLLSGTTGFGIDIGSESVGGGADKRLVLRVHLRHPGQFPDLPTQVEGIPVRVTTADYELE